MGSGTGKALIAASTLHLFESVSGIELLEGLYNTSVEVTDKYKASAQPPSAIEVHHGDLLEPEVADWAAADIVLCNCACFPAEMMEAISTLSEPMKVGAFFVTVSIEFRSEHFTLVDQASAQMSWGEATVFIYQRNVVEESSLEGEGLEDEEDDSEAEEKDEDDDEYRGEEGQGEVNVMGKDEDNEEEKGVGGLEDEEEGKEDGGDNQGVVKEEKEEL